MIRSLLFALTLFSLPLHGEDLASLARLVNQPADAEAAERVMKALAHEDPEMRALAARVAAVQNLDVLLDELRDQLRTEKDAEAAREEVRAVILIGGKDEADFVVGEIARFGSRLDGAFASAIARLGPTDAFSLYDSHLRDRVSLGDSGNFVKLAAWGQPDLLAPFAARLLANRDERGWKELVEALWDADVMLAPGLLIAAMSSESAAIRNDAAWLLAQSLACEGELQGCRSDLDPVNRELIFKELVRETESDDSEFLFAREMARRVLAIETPEKRVDARDWLAGDAALVRLKPSRLEKFLSKTEKKIVDEEKSGRNTSVLRSHALRPPPFLLPSPLPAGVADALAGKNCRFGWVALAKATLDDRTRVRSLDIDPIQITTACVQALETMARLSLPTALAIDSPRSSGGILMVRGSGPLCTDESDVPETSTAWNGEPRRVGPLVSAPKVVKRSDPSALESARREARHGDLGVRLQALVTREGCVRDVILTSQSPSASFNSSATKAVTDWQFKPATLISTGEAVDSRFDLTISLKVN